MADRDYTITGPGGRELTITGPDNATPAQLRAAAEKAFSMATSAPVAQPDAGGGLEAKLRAGIQPVANVVAGAVRGAGSIGATLLAPFDMAKDAIDGKGLSLESNRQRRADMDNALRDLGADPDSTAYKAGKLGGEIAGTAGTGGVLANAITRVAPAAAVAMPGAVNAIRSAGFTAGAKAPGVAGALANTATRAAGGAITGAASAGLVNPEDAVTGALVGGALPPALQVAGAAGRKVAELVRSVRSGIPSGAADMMRALGIKDADIPAVVAQLRGAETLVPGAPPTVAQVLQTPQASVLQRVVYDSAGGSTLQNKIAQQGSARVAALERVAPTEAEGIASARQNLGESVSRFANSADQAARARTSEIYKSIPQDEAALYLPDLGAIRDKYFGPAVFTDRAAVDAAVSTAKKVGGTELPAVAATRGGASPRSLAQAVRRAGGVSITENNGLRGEVAGLREDLKNIVRVNGGLSPERMAMKMREAGYLESESADDLFRALREEATGNRQFSIADDLSRTYQSAADAAMGDAPGAASIPKKITLGDFEDLRKSIGQEQRAAASSGNATSAKALGDMKAALDSRIDEVVRGDGAIDENLPIAWADALTKARQAKVDQVQRFRTGPQAALFKVGSDGQPAVQGGEVAAKFWGNRPGLADDVESFKRLVGDNPQLLGQFRSMVTTSGAATADAAGNLTTKFSKWVDQSLPGLKSAFKPEDVTALQRIAQDIDRAAAAQKLGTSLGGSNTYQNAQNALSLGLLDSPMLSRAASMVPGVRLVADPALAGIRDSARKARANQLAALLADPDETARALEMLATNRAASGRANPLIDALGVSGLRAAPVAAGSR